MAEQQKAQETRKPKNTRWTVLSCATLVVFAAMFVLCVLAPCQGSYTTISAGGECGGSCGCGGACTADSCGCGGGMAVAITKEAVQSGELDLNARVADGTCTFGETPMLCHWAYLASAVAALFGVLAALGMFRLPGVHGRRFAGILAACAAVAAALFPFALIGTCGASSAICHVMRLLLLALCVLAVACGVLAWFWCKPRKTGWDL